MGSFQELLEYQKAQKDYQSDYHILRFFSSFVAVSHGRVVKVTEPRLEYCPLAGMFYRKMRNAQAIGTDELKKNIQAVVEEKIRRFGFFTKDRNLTDDKIAVPYGASEILMYALRKEAIEAAVVVCDGAGSVVTARPELIQGIGARMNGLFYTTRVDEIISRLKDLSVEVPFSDTRIDQTGAVERACEMGYKRIAVTVNAFMQGERFEKIRSIERKFNAVVSILAVCTTGTGLARIAEMKEYADLVWGCASQEVREEIGPQALLQVSESIPVFVLTKQGLNILAAYTDQKNAFSAVQVNAQHLLSHRKKGKPVTMGDRTAYLSRSPLPVRSGKEPY